MNTQNIIKSDNQPYLRFFNTNRNVIQNDIWGELSSGLWKSFSVENYLYNDSVGEVNQHLWKQVVPNIYPINPGFVWDFSKNCLTAELYFPQLVDSSFDKFIGIVENYFKQFEGRKIGVHLSGGLDSSIIIGLLHYLKIPFTPIGLVCKRFEFRTERHIQEKLLEWGDNGRLIDIEQYPFWSNLLMNPKQQLPDSNIMMNNASFALANAFHEAEVDVVINGQGGDSLFYEAIPNRGFNIGNEFLNLWDEVNNYKPNHCELYSFYADKQIINHIYSLRYGQDHDPIKKWARQFFKPILPFELSDYYYKSDYFGIDKSGLSNARHDIQILFEEAYDRLGHEIFSPMSIREFLSIDVNNLEYKTYCAYCSKISIAVWLHSLFRKDEKSTNSIFS